MPELINPGPDHAFDSNYVASGPRNDDKPQHDAANKYVSVGISGRRDTDIAADDVWNGAFIVDGTDRVCNTDIVLPDVAGSLAKGQLEPAPLKGNDDWGTLAYAFDPNADVDQETTTGDVLPKEQSFDDLRALEDQNKRADLGVSIAVSAPQVHQGDAVTFHVGLTNSGPDGAKGAQAFVRLPAGMAWSSCSSGPSSSCGFGGNIAFLDGATLASGTTVSADFTIATDCTTPSGALTVTVQSSGTIPDLVASDNNASATTQVGASGPVFLAVPPTVTTTVCTGVQLGTPVAQRACGGSVTLTNNAPATYPLGTTVVTWTATSAAGTVTATQSVIAKLGDSTTCCPAGSHVILGTPNNDTLNGTAGVDCILGRGGQDHINGLGGDDVISGGDGDDVIDGGAGNDRIFGGTGQDNLTGGAGDDLLDGNDGDDILHGGLGNDTLRGGPGQDQLFGEDGNDSLFGDAGSDTLDGGTGTNYLEGDTGTDTCNGSAATNQFVSCETRPGAPRAGDLCADGTKDGAESDVDCGGTGCHGCTGGRACTLGGDCLSQVCAGGACTAPSSPLVVSLVVTSDWGPGYCALLNAYNSGATATAAWSATLDTKGTTIYQTTKASITPTSGIATVAPQSTELVVAPGAANTNVTFCANRPSGDTTSVAIVTSSSGNY